MPRPTLTALTGATRRRALLIGAGAVTVVALGAGTSAAFAATPAATPSASTSASARQYPSLRAITRELPGSLRADLKTLHKDPKSEKAAERKAIEAKALSGAYGPEIERVAHLFGGKGGAKGASVLPAALKADLKTLRGDAKGSQARTDEFDAIWGKALAGTYGTTIETAAKAAVAHFQAHHQG